MESIRVIFYMICILYFIVSIKKIFKMKKSRKKIQELENTNSRLQKSYDSVRAFKHDFNNIMQSIGGYIALNDMNGLRNMYNSIVEECKEINNAQGINEIVINNPAIYNLINHKYNLASNNNVLLEVKVLIDLKQLNISDLDLCRILGILIDNAIEAAKECDKKFVSVKFIYDKLNKRNLIIIENPCKNELIDINKIYEKGFSSKKKKLNHGLGLWKVKQILKKNKNVVIYTSRDKLFKQQLEIY